MSKSASSYSAKDIKAIIKDIDKIRKKPAYYLGVPAESNEAHHQICKELWDNARDEAINGHNDVIGFAIDKEGWNYVWDRGRGIPIEKNKETGLSTLTVVYNFIQAGGKLDKEQKGYKKSSGTHGIGAAVSCGLSELFHVYTHRNGKWYTQAFKRGHPTNKVRILHTIPKIPGYGKLKKGTLIQYKPDTSIIGKKTHLDTKHFIKWLETQSYLCSKINLYAYIDGKEYKYYQEDGLRTFVTKLLKKNNAEKDGKCFLLHTENVDIALQWSTFHEEIIKAYVNGSPTTDYRSTQVIGLHKAITEALQPFKNTKSKYKAEDLRCGLLSVVNLSIASPEYDSQSKSKLVDKKAIEVVYNDVFPALKKFFSENKSLAKNIIARANEVRKVQQQFTLSKKAASALRINKGGKVLLPVKLTVSNTKNAEERELFLVEGSSAGGGAKQARDSNYQEVLCLKGKIINTAKDKKGKIFESNEVIDILKSIGYDPSAKKFKMRVGKIILFTDADVDGPLSGDTKVLLLNGKKLSMKYLAKKWEKDKEPFWVYSRDSNGKLIPTLAENPRITCYKDEIVELTLNNGHKIKCTKKHAFVVNNPRKKDKRIIWYKGNPFIRAIDLEKSDSINSIYFRHGNADGDVVCRDMNIKKLDSFVRNYGVNHTIFRKRVLKVGNKPMYCLTVPETGNFMIDDGKGNGICSANCHISSLLLALLVKVVPEVIKQGKVYVINSPLFMAKKDNKVIYGKSLKDVYKPNWIVTRIKGWAEANKEELRDIAFDPKKRSLTMVTMEDVKSLKRFSSIMGEDTSIRKEIVGI